MFYDKQATKDKEQYKEMLNMVGRLSNLFSESSNPYLAYRAHENIFCRCFDAVNLARGDDSADAQKGNIGIGLKTWTGNNDQKVAEFGRLLPQYKDLTGLELVKRIAEYRNERIRVTKNLHGIDVMIYHVVKRVPHTMQILECAFDPVDIDKIRILENRCSETNTYFTDGKHTYHFSNSKHTLYMIFDDLELLDEVEVDIIADPFVAMISAFGLQSNDRYITEKTEGYTLTQRDDIFEVTDVRANDVSINESQLCLRLYTHKGKGNVRKKYVQEKSGLNQWNAAGRKRDCDEIYIPYPAEDRARKEDFFPPQDIPFDLHLPDGKIISAKVCQQDRKAIMSNPNKELGHWLLRDVFELEEGTVLTYEKLERFGIDSVIFTKKGDLEYSIEFSELGTYERFYGIEE